MLVYCKESETSNDVHIVIGDESELNYTLYGNLTFNLNDYSKNFNKKKITKIIITRVNSEEYSMHQLQQLQMMQQQSLMAKDLISYVQNKSEHKLDSKTIEDGVFVPDIICPKCNNKGVIVKKGEPALCKTCSEIEKGLISKKKKKEENLEGV